jgi:hypothetical protein
LQCLSHPKKLKRASLWNLSDLLHQIFVDCHLKCKGVADSFRIATGA